MNFTVNKEIQDYHDFVSRDKPIRDRFYLTSKSIGVPTTFGRSTLTRCGVRVTGVDVSGLLGSLVHQGKPLFLPS